MAQKLPRKQPLRDSTMINKNQRNREMEEQKGSDSRKKYRKIDNSWKQFSIKEIFVPNANRNPHGNLTKFQLSKLRIRRKNICYIVGLPQNMLNENVLSSSEWFGKFGKIKSISFQPNLYDPHNIHGVYIIYLSDISTLNAIKYANLCLFNDGRKLKATFGSQIYCKYFLEGQVCNIPNHKHLHYWAKPEDVMTEKEIIKFDNMLFGNIGNPYQTTQNTFTQQTQLPLYPDTTTIEFQLIQLQRNQINALQEQLELMKMNLKSQHQKTQKWRNLYEMLQNPYNALDERYKKLQKDHDILNKKYEALLVDKENDYKSWNYEQVICWITSIHNGYFRKYEKELRGMIASENIDGSCLNVLDGNDIYRMGINNFKDKQLLYDEIKRLTNKCYDYKYHHMDTIMENEYPELEGDSTAE